MSAPPEPLDPQEIAVKAEQCRRNLRLMVREAWPIVQGGRPFIDNWHIGAVCEQLQAVSAGEIRRLVINVPPRSTKSITTAVVWPAWEWLSSPEIGWLFASYGDRLAVRHSVMCRRLIQSEGVERATPATPWLRRVGYRGMLAALGESWELAGDVNLKTEFENSAAGYRIATSVGGAVTGDGGDRLVIDDPSKAEAARSPVKLAEAREWFDDTWSTRLNDPATSAQVVIMQRLHEADLTGHLIGQGDWEHLVLPAEYEPKHPFAWPDDPRTQEGESIDPVRFPKVELQRLRRALGSIAYAGQMQQRPAPAEGGMFRRHWWRRWGPQDMPGAWGAQIMSWDMAFKDTEGASFVVGQVWGVDGPNRYLLGQIRGRLDFTRTCAAVIDLATWRPEARARLVEDKANGPAVMNALQRRLSGLIPIEPDGSKAARAAAITPLVEAGNVYLPDAEFIPCPPGYEPTTVAEFIEEHANFPMAARNDQVDTTSQSLNWLEAHPLGGGGEQGGWSFSGLESHAPESQRISRGGLTRVGPRYFDRDETGKSVPPPGYVDLDAERRRREREAAGPPQIQSAPDRDELLRQKYPTRAGDAA